MSSKRIFITGATGFLGKYLLPLLINAGYDVVALTRKKTVSGIFDSMYRKKITWCMTEKEIEREFKKGIECVVHIATCYGREQDTFADVVETNLLLPVRILEKAVLYGCKGFINADTFFHENLGLQPKERSYITTKKLFLELARGITQSTSVKLINMRIEQMYGPGDHGEKFIPGIIHKLRSNPPTIELTKGEQKRDLVFVEDAAEAFVAAVMHIDCFEKLEEFGVGTGMSTSIKDTVLFLQKTMKNTSKLEWGSIPYRDREIMDSKATIDNNNNLKWTAKTGWREGLEQTIHSIVGDL